MTSRAAYIFNITESMDLFCAKPVYTYTYAHRHTKMDTASVVTMIAKDEIKDNGTCVRVFARRDYKMKLIHSTKTDCERKRYCSKVHVPVLSLLCVL